MDNINNTSKADRARAFIAATATKLRDQGKSVEVILGKLQNRNELMFKSALPEEELKAIAEGIEPIAKTNGKSFTGIHCLRITGLFVSRLCTTNSYSDCLTLSSTILGVAPTLSAAAF